MAVHVGELIVGRYELELLVGEGGMSTVYRAYDTVLERRVAIKVLHEHYSRDPSTSSASAARPARSPGSRTPTSSPSSTAASGRGGSSSSSSTSPART